MEKPNLIIFTVGTSLLLGNKRKYNGVGGGVQRNLPTKTEKSIKEEINKDDSAFNKFLKELLKVDTKTEINKRGPPYDPENNPDNLPAELSGFYLFYFTPENIPDTPDTIPSKEPKDKVALLYSPDTECVFCAYCIEKYLTTKFSAMIDEVKMIRIDGLDPKDKVKFERNGMRNLLSKISELITKYKDAYNIVLNITGGYKGAVPYLTLLGMCYEGIEVTYLFEESKANITLPKMPVAFDIFTWRDYRGFINTIPKLEEEQAKAILEKVLPAQVRGLFDGKELNALGDELKRIYEKEKIILTPFGRGFLLTERIKDKVLKKYLQGCIEQWQHLWIGDKIPEMVEHQRGHTQRVLELAAEMLYPILEDEKREIFQNDVELASFIGAIWLHDLGNSGEMFKLDEQEYVIKGFPSLIRDFHNVVTDTIIQEDEEKPVEERLLFPEVVEVREGEVIKRRTIGNIDQIIENIRIISKYHRKWTPLTQDKVDKKGKHCIKLTEPVKDDNLRFLTAIYRVLDTCDTQLERTVDDAYRDTRKMIVDREVKILIKEKREIEGNREVGDFIEHFKNNGHKKCSDIDLNSLKGNLDWIINKDEDTGKQIDKYADCINYIVGNTKTCSNSKVSDIVERWLSCLDQIFFKKRQPLHYEKHKGIDAVMILPEPDRKENKIYKFNIRMVGAKGTTEQRLRYVLEQDIIDNKYVEVKEVLAPFIEFEFSYQCYGQEPKPYKEVKNPK